MCQTLLQSVRCESVKQQHFLQSHVVKARDYMRRDYQVRLKMDLLIQAGPRHVEWHTIEL